MWEVCVRECVCACVLRGRGRECGDVRRDCSPECECPASCKTTTTTTQQQHNNNNNNTSPHLSRWRCPQGACCGRPCPSSSQSPAWRSSSPFLLPLLSQHNQSGEAAELRIASTCPKVVAKFRFLFQSICFTLSSTTVTATVAILSHLVFPRLCYNYRPFKKKRSGETGLFLNTNFKRPKSPHHSTQNCGARAPELP